LYQWAGTHGGPEDIGVISDPFTAEATLICRAARTRPLAIIVYDGQCSATQFVEVSCAGESNGSDSD
jgi:hypothetical protein